MAATQKEIYVYAHWAPMAEPLLMGKLYSELLRGKEVFSFEYHKGWLQSGFAQSLDPDLLLYSGPQYLNDEKPNFGLFLDSSPDRWGQLLMRRREAALARKEDRKPKRLFATDYLLGVYDGHRMGALRFKEDPEGPFLNDNREMASPPWASLRKLQEVSLNLEQEDAARDPAYLKWLNLLIAPGSSLGGARPKASILDPKDHLWIAKFPSRNDLKDVGAWEKVAHDLAMQCGINLAEAQVQKFTGQHHTFLTKRFDRSLGNKRIHFASAMTLLGHTDGYDSAGGASYLELAEFLMSEGAEVERDLEELWRRIVFSICISNTDDHLRNHGFILTAKGWRLSPAYDINPVENGTGLSLNISEDDNALDLDLARKVAPYFRLQDKTATKFIDQTLKVVAGWPKVAAQYRISRDEREHMTSAFLS